MPLWSLFVWGDCHVPRNISEWGKREGWIPGRESGPFFVPWFAVRSWCCPREPAQAGSADRAWWSGAFALLGEGAMSLGTGRDTWHCVSLLTMIIFAKRL